MLDNGKTIEDQEFCEKLLESEKLVRIKAWIDAGRPRFYRKS